MNTFKSLECFVSHFHLFQFIKKLYETLKWQIKFTHKFFIVLQRIKEWLIINHVFLIKYFLNIYFSLSDLRPFEHYHNPMAEEATVTFKFIYVLLITITKTLNSMFSYLRIAVESKKKLELIFSFQNKILNGFHFGFRSRSWAMVYLGTLIFWRSFAYKNIWDMLSNWYDSKIYTCLASPVKVPIPVWVCSSATPLHIFITKFVSKKCFFKS